jgi:uncharacterized protein YndB with AHSA1/START domain
MEVMMSVSREIDVDAPPEQVWEALATEEGRERWLDEPGRDMIVTESTPSFPLATLAASFALVAA